MGLWDPSPLPVVPPAGAPVTGLPRRRRDIAGTASPDQRADRAVRSGTPGGVELGAHLRWHGRLDLGEQGRVRLDEAGAARVVERLRVKLLEQLPDHAPHSQELGRVADQLVECGPGVVVVEVVACHGARRQGRTDIRGMVSGPGTRRQPSRRPRAAMRRAARGGWVKIALAVPSQLRGQVSARQGASSTSNGSSHR